jgi:hypothetical protein
LEGQWLSFFLWLQVGNDFPVTEGGWDTSQAGYWGSSVLLMVFGMWPPRVVSQHRGTDSEFDLESVCGVGPVVPWVLKHTRPWPRAKRKECVFQCVCPVSVSPCVRGARLFGHLRYCSQIRNGPFCELIEGVEYLQGCHRSPCDFSGDPTLPFRTHEDSKRQQLASPGPVHAQQREQQPERARTPVVGHPPFPHWRPAAHCSNPAQQANWQRRELTSGSCPAQSHTSSSPNFPSFHQRNPRRSAHHELREEGRGRRQRPGQNRPDAGLPGR